MSITVLETDIAVLKKDNERHERFLEKLELAIIKMGEATNSISRMLAIHEERLLKSQATDKEIIDLVEKRRVEIVEDVEKLHTRINTLSQEVAKEITHTEKRITQVFEVGLEELKQYMIEDKEENKLHKKELQERIAKLETWRWYVLGIVAGVGFVFASLLKVAAIW
jgi:hypothetical protein